MASSREIRVNTNPVANHYAADNERIIEFSSPAGGGLIGFNLDGDHLTIDVYRYDSTVTVRVGQPDS